MSSNSTANSDKISISNKSAAKLDKVWVSNELATKFYDIWNFKFIRIEFGSNFLNSNKSATMSDKIRNF